MAWARSSFQLALVLLLASLIPLLFFLDYLVEQGGRRAAWVEAELHASLDGQESLFLAVPLAPVGGGATKEFSDMAHAGLEVEGRGVLRQDHYPWEATPYEARFWLRIDPALLTNPRPGIHEEGFAASFTLRQTTRSDGLGLPPVPCKGHLLVRDLTFSHSSSDKTSLEDLKELSMNIDLLCTAAGPDLLFNTGDERTWTLEGTLRLRSGQMPL